MSQISDAMSTEEAITNTSPPEISPIPESPSEESNHVKLISSTPIPSDTQRSNSFPSNLIDTNGNIETFPLSNSANSTLFVVTSPSFNSDLSAEQNDDVNQLDSSSVSYLQSKQRRIDHRRNKSEPVKSQSTEDLSSNSVINNDSSNNNTPTETPKKSTAVTTPSSSSSSRKKKAWYNPFQSSYRQRYEEFRKLFKDVPDEERLIVDYSCAWQKDILVQGRVYLSQNYLCFYANILNWKSHLCLKFDDIVGITREKTAKVISNAIEIKTNKGEKYFFASFVTRDKTYAIMHRIWQSVSDNQPISSQQLWTMIHESYGDDLDMTTDDDDSYRKSALNSPSDKPSSKSPSQSLDKYDRLTPNSILPTPFPQQEDDQSSVSSRGEHASDDEGIIPIGEEARTNTLMRRPQSNSTEQSISPTSEVRYLTKCHCESHLSTELINRTYPMSVEHLFDCIFGDNDFLVAYRASRRIKDFHSGQWKMNDETGKRERVCTYKVTVSAVFGSTTICSNERQIVDCEQPKSHYILDTEVRNEGIKYADSFFVASRYCLVQTGPNKAHLKVTCEVRYVKSLMAIIKTFIEKNALAALQDSFTDLMKRIDQESSKKPRALSISNNNETQSAAESPSLPMRRLSRQQQPDELLSSINDLSINSQDDDMEPIHDQKRADAVISDSSRNSIFIPVCFITMLLLLIVNIFLCVKLNQIDQMTERLVQNYPSWLNQYSSEQDEHQWSSLLKRQEEYYQMQLNSLHSVLTTTHNALRNVTETLHQLSKLSSGSS